MTNIPNIKDNKYFTIEYFQDFELMECMAWEMAIRNDKVQVLLSEMSDIRKNIYSNYAYLSQDNKIVFINEFNDDYNGSPVDILKFLLDERIFCEEQKNKISDLEKNARMNDSLGTYLISELEELKKLMNDFEKKYKAIPKKFGPVNTTKTFLLSHQELPELIDMANQFYAKYEILKNEYFILFENYLRSEEHPGKSIANAQEVSWGIGNKELEPKTIKSKSDQEINYNLFPIRSRPRLTIPANMTNALTLEINFNLPLQNLKSYIEVIQDKYKKNKQFIQPTYIKSNLCSENFSFDLKENINSGRRTKELSTLINDRQKMKLLFFIYDCIKKNVKASEISDLLFFASEEAEKTHITTIQLYYEAAKYLIDEKHYKELLTGFFLP
ncbi:MAG: hypothetical protein AB7S65_00035 [Sulfuricurvum sp.]